MKKWEHFPHTADIGIRGIGNNIEEAFEMGAMALIAVIAEPDSIKTEETVSIKCKSKDFDYLFFDWINAVNYEIEMRKMLFSRFDVKIDNFHLKADIMGEKIDLKRHQAEIIVKGATFTELKVFQKNGIWIAQCVVDV